jgi:hypothetical protein
MADRLVSARLVHDKGVNDHSERYGRDLKDRDQVPNTKIMALQKISSVIASKQHIHHIDEELWTDSCMAQGEQTWLLQLIRW